MTERRWLLVVSPATTTSEWAEAAEAFAEALLTAADDALIPVRAGPNGWVRPADRAPVAAPDFRDIVLICAAGWDDPAQLPLLEAAQKAGARLVAYVHDIAPIRRPEWFPPERGKRFTDWLGALLGLCQMIVAPSAATIRDVEAWRRRTGLADLAAKRVRPGDAVLPPPTDRLPPQSHFVLMAGPLDARIGHSVVLSTWRRLGARANPGALPRLVIAGPPGHLTADLRERLTRGLPNVSYLPNAAPVAISALLDSCLFAIHPAPLEGWGFLVSDALARGKPVFAANSGGLPEAGQRSARYFDPLDTDDLARQVERAVRDPHDLRRWHNDIAANYQPRGWDEAAIELLTALAPLA
jgi:glycosyltransferase involved in cell wall biosynthesis